MYTAVPTEEEQGESTLTPKSRLPMITFIAAAVVSVILAGLFALAVIRGTVELPPFGTELADHPCGQSPKDAEALDCEFDILLRFWVPKECFYPEITEAFTRRRKSAYYSDVNGTMLLEDQDLSHYAGPIFTTEDYHSLHCVFLLRRNHLAVRSGGKLPAMMTSYEHTEHCTEALTHTSNNEGLISIFELQYPACVSARAALSIV